MKWETAGPPPPAAGQMLPKRHLGSLLATLVALLFIVAAPPARAAVTVRAAACNSFSIAFWPPYSMDIPKPTGTATGDLMIATVRTSGFYSASSGPTGWTEFLNDGASSVTWYKWATASEPTSYTFGGPSGGGSMAGGIVSFTGVDPATPFADSAQTTSGTAASIALPSATGTRAGSMRYSTITSGDNISVTFAGMTEDCDRNVGAVGMASAHEATGVGAVQARTAVRSGTGSNVAQTFVINPASACSTGALSMTPPSTISFPSTALNGYNQTQLASTTLRIDDRRALATGWNLSATSTSFTSGANALASNAAKVEDVRVTPAAGNCSVPTSLLTYPQNIPAAPVAPTASKLFSAATGTGSGPVDVTLDLSLFLPSYTKIGNYSSTWTFTLAAGP